MNRFTKLVREIHRRSIWQVLGIYVVGSWLVLQVVGPPTSGADTGVDEEAAGVAGQDLGGATPSAAHGSEAERQLFTWRNAILGGGVAFALWGIVAAGWLALKGAPAGLGGADEAIPSLAALPFDNMSGDPEDTYFTDGIQEEILARLARIDRLRVISRTSVLEYRDSPKNLQEIAGELGVDHVLEGSVRGHPRFEALLLEHEPVTE